MEKFIVEHMIEIVTSLIVLLFVSRCILYFQMLEKGNETITKKELLPDYFHFFGPETTYNQEYIKKYNFQEDEIAYHYPIFTLGTSFTLCKYFSPNLFRNDEPSSVGGNRDYYCWYIDGRDCRFSFKDGILVEVFLYLSESDDSEDSERFQIKEEKIINVFTGEVIGWIDMDEKRKKNSELEEKIRFGQETNL